VVEGVALLVWRALIVRKIVCVSPRGSNIWYENWSVRRAVVNVMMWSQVKRIEVGGAEG